MIKMSSIFKNSKSVSIQMKLIISYFLLTFIPLVIVGFLAYNISALSIKKEVTGYISKLLQQVNDNIDNEIYELDRIASGLSVDTSVLEILDKPKTGQLRDIYKNNAVMDEKINTLMDFRTNIEGLFLFSYDGEVYQYRGINNSIRLDYIFTSARWYLTMKSQGVSKLLIPTHTQDEVLTSGKKKVVFSYVKEIRDFETGKSLGDVLIDVNTDVIKKIWDKLNTQSSIELMIVDNNKTIIYHTHEEMISTQFRSNYISKILEEKNGSIITTINKRPALVTFNTSPLSNWTVISIIPINVLYKDITKISYVIIVAVGLFMLLSLFISVLISRSITRPIFELRKTMKLAEMGQLDINVPIKRNDEIGALSTSFNNMLGRINSLIQTVYETKILKREAELSALQAQINPHFLYNTLQTIDILAENEGIWVISMVCRSLSRMFRYSISRGREFIPLSSELEHIKDYIYIQKLRFKERFEVEYEIEKNLLDYRVIKLIIQPIVENALLHAVQNKKDKCIIKISAKVITETLYITVEDTGLGIDEEQLKDIKESLNDEIIHTKTDNIQTKSIGMKNVNSRIRMYFGESYGVSIDSTINIGTKVTLTIPAIVHE